MTASMTASTTFAVAQRIAVHGLARVHGGGETGAEQ